MNSRFIEHGTYNPNYQPGNGLISSRGVIALRRTLYSEIPKAYRRIMYNFDQYNFVDSTITNSRGEKFVIFCHCGKENTVISDINQYKDTAVWLVSDFWMDVENDWIVFLEGKREAVEFEIRDDYKNWWLKHSPEIREEMYFDALK